MNQPPIWTREQLEKERIASEEFFRTNRYEEPLETYTEYFDQYQSVVEEVIEETVDLSQFDERALEILSDPRKYEVFRYLTGPPISHDDLKVLMETKSFAASRLKDDLPLLGRIAQFLRDWHDRRRFPWLNDTWEPGEPDRKTAVIATTALIAMRKTETARRNDGKSIQEENVEKHLLSVGFKKVKTRSVKTLNKAPVAGEFCRESTLGKRKADFIIGLWDGRTLAIECKVSNSSTNSVKRLNNDAAAKAETWRVDLGATQVVTAAVLAGVFALRNLEDAQDRGLAIFWGHRLDALTDWITSTKP